MFISWGKREIKHWDNFNILMCSTYMKVQKQPVHHFIEKTAALFPARQLWTEVKSERFITILLGRHADPPPGPQPNRDTHHISWPVRPNRIPCCSKEALSSGAPRKESTAELSGRTEAATCFSHYSGSKLNGSFSPADIVRLWNVIWDAGGGSLES